MTVMRGKVEATVLGSLWIPTIPCKFLGQRARRKPDSWTPLAERQTNKVLAKSEGLFYIPLYSSVVN